MPGHSVMISYSQVDEEIAKDIIQSFKENNISYWVAFEGIKTTENWPAAISRAINDCTIFLLIFTPNSNKSRQVVREITRADDCKKLLYCLQTEKFTISDDFKFFISSIQRLEAFKYDWQKAKEILIKDIKEIPGKEIADDKENEELQITSDNEERLWNNALMFKTVQLYQAYLSDFPNGKYHSLAIERINMLNSQTPPDLKQEGVLRLNKKLLYLIGGACLIFLFGFLFRRDMIVFFKNTNQLSNQGNQPFAKDSGMFQKQSIDTVNNTPDTPQTTIPQIKVATPEDKPGRSVATIKETIAGTKKEPDPPPIKYILANIEGLVYLNDKKHRASKAIIFIGADSVGRADESGYFKIQKQVENTDELRIRAKMNGNYSETMLVGTSQPDIRLLIKTEQ